MSTVMVVEEDRLLRQALAACLKRLGYGVLEAPDALAAFAGLDCQPVDAVLLDVHPATQGLELLEYMRTREDLAGVPVLAIVGTDGPDELLDLLPPGDRLHLPFDLPFLDWLLKRLLPAPAAGPPVTYTEER